MNGYRPAEGIDSLPKGRAVSYEDGQQEEVFDTPFQVLPMKRLVEAKYVLGHWSATEKRGIVVRGGGIGSVVLGLVRGDELYAVDPQTEEAAQFDVDELRPLTIGEPWVSPLGVQTSYSVEQVAFPRATESIGNSSVLPGTPPTTTLYSQQFGWWS